MDRYGEGEGERGRGKERERRWTLRHEEMQIDTRSARTFPPFSPQSGTVNSAQLEEATHDMMQCQTDFPRNSRRFSLRGNLSDSLIYARGLTDWHAVIFSQLHHFCTTRQRSPPTAAFAPDFARIRPPLVLALLYYSCSRYAIGNTSYMPWSRTRQRVALTASGFSAG